MQAALQLSEAHAPFHTCLSNSVSMPRKASKKPARKAKANAEKQPLTPLLAALAIAIIAIASVFAYFYIANANASSINAFKSAYAASNSIAIYANATISNYSSSVFSCASALIEQAYAPSIYATQINYFVIANNSCLYKKYIKGSVESITGNYTTLSLQQCMAIGKSMPSVFIGYAAANKTFAEGNALYAYGNAAFLNNCGIAYMLT